jgi:DNA-binding MarR family transcriptional regulator
LTKPSNLTKPGSAAPAVSFKTDSKTAVRSWLAVVRAYNLCDATLTRRLAPLGVRPAEHDVLANLQRYPGISQQALADRCFIAKSHISALVSALEARGLVQRTPDPTDARARQLYVTAEGAALAERTSAVLSGVVAVMADTLTLEEMVQIEDAMTRVSVQLSTRLLDMT